MGKLSFKNLKKYLLPLNILIIVVLFCAYHYVDTEINKQKIIEGVSSLLDNEKHYYKISRAHNPYGDGLASKRIVEFIKKN